VVQRGGFPPVHLAEINFQAMYEQQQAEAAAAAAATPAAPQIIV
jgi:preprotein translocase subunit SecB